MEPSAPRGAFPCNYTSCPIMYGPWHTHDANGAPVFPPPVNECSPFDPLVPVRKSELERLRAIEAAARLVDTRRLRELLKPDPSPWWPPAGCVAGQPQAPHPGRSPEVMGAGLAARTDLPAGPQRRR